MVELLQNGILRVSSGSTSFLPVAKEIYSVVFGDTAALRGTEVSAADFKSCGLAFSPHVVDIGLLFEAVSSAVVCGSIRAFYNNLPFQVPRSGNELLDYVCIEGVWFPLAPGGLDGIISFCRSCGTADKDLANLFEGCRVDVAFYLRALRARPDGLRIEDKTGGRFQAARISEAADGGPPSGIQASLYPYQLKGYRWLRFMNTSGLGALLADEMGLGKTLQVICLLQDAKNSGAGPNLVVAPASILENWRREIAKFAPGIKAMVHAGSKRTGFPTQLSSYDVVVSSYETVVGDLSMLLQLQWNLVVIDEAQNIKNPAAKRTLQLKKLNRRCGIAVTGTPVENSLTDLWSVMDFAVPDLLGPLDAFMRTYPDTPDSADSVEPLVAPLVLRRLVEDVAQDLPERVDIPVPLLLDDRSAHLYNDLRQAAGAPGGAGLGQLVKLRQFCTHPWLVGSMTETTNPVDCSVKFQRLMELVEEVAQEGRKMIIFTSFQASFDLIKDEIATRFAIYVNGIDGRVPVSSRQGIVDAFMSVNGPGAIVLNPKAAGTGLNITAANYVIHYNLEWNPAVEDQATARAYRRGQFQRVFVYRLFYRDTVEEVMDERMLRKRVLAGAAVSSTDESLEVADILRALTLSPIK